MSSQSTEKAAANATVGQELGCERCQNRISDVGISFLDILHSQIVGQVAWTNDFDPISKHKDPHWCGNKVVAVNESVGQQFCSDGQMGHHGRDTNEQRQNDIRFDLERVIAALPEDLQDLCEKLQSSNMAEIAREMGVPRSTLYGKLTKLRDAFRDGGLEEYL